MDYTGTVFLYKELKENSYEDFLKTIETISTIERNYPMLTMLMDGFSEVQRFSGRVCEILMNARNYSDLRAHNRDAIELETEDDNLKEGIMAMLWGATIIVSKKIPVHTILFLPDAQYRQVSILNIMSEDRS